MLTYPDLDPVAIQIGPVAVHWYGLMYAAAFALGWWILQRRRQRLGLTADQVGDLAFYVILGVILGGRLGYVLFYNPAFYAAHPLQILAVWDGGMAFHGGLVGVVVAGIVFAQRYDLRILELADYLTPVVPIGLGLGRIGNFINGELWGRTADPDLPWAMIFPHVDRLPRHPSQLYEALGEGLLLLAVVLAIDRLRLRPGRLFGAFLTGYGVVRFLLEYFRAPDPQLGLLALGLSMGQWLCLPMIAVGAWLLLRRSAQPPAAGDGVRPSRAA